MTSVLLEFTMFPTDKTGSKSNEVAQVVKIIRQSGFPYQLTAMATLVETKNIKEALFLVEACYNKLEELGCNRVYSTLKFDIRKDCEDRLNGKVKSIEDKIGEVRK